LEELKEYAQEIDVAFVRRSIQAIGEVARMKEATNACVDILVDLLQSKADYACEECVIVLCDVIRSFPR
jgi:vesicle coat complex subunit